MTDIFEITNDLPDEIKANLTSLKKTNIDKLVIGLLAFAKRPLTINELVVGLYRKHEMQIDRAKLIAVIYRLVANKKIVKQSKTLYAINNVEVGGEEK